ncbi:MAG: MFS transporter, partial [Clostridiales Family XIII bacterium]|nr:MFS transporter [Clostridiales Family XIII bacterium]
IALIGILYGVSTIFAGSIVLDIAGVITGIIFLILFVKRQSKLAQPLIDLAPLKVKPFRIGVIINMLSLITMFAMNIIIPIFMQSVMGVSSFSASFILFPAIALCCILSPLAGRVYDKHGAKVLLPVGFALVCIFSITLSLFIGGGSVWLLAILYIPVIGGSALIIGPAQSLALSHLAPEENPHGVTVLSTGFQIAGCIGASVFTGVYALVTSTSAASGASINAAGSAGFLSTGIGVSIVALIGIILAFKLGSYPKATAIHRQTPFDLSQIKKSDV